MEKEYSRAEIAVVRRIEKVLSDILSDRISDNTFSIRLTMAISALEYSSSMLSLLIQLWQIEIQTAC